jgi:hypothetical protein
MKFSVKGNKYEVTLPNDQGYFQICNSDKYPNMSIHICETSSFRGKGYSYRMIKLLLERTMDVFKPSDMVYIDTEASEICFWSKKLEMADTYEETGYEYGITFDKLRRNIRKKVRQSVD